MSELEFQRDEVLPFEEDGFAVKARRVFERMLREPVSLPDEYKAWLPLFIEQSNIQVPVSQLVGSYVTADTVAGLGAKIHGRRGMVRAGASDYNTVELVYDEVVGKWVSSPVTVITQNNQFDTTSSTSYVDSTEASGTLLSWGEWTDAGLTMLFRFLTGIRTTHSSETAKATVRFTPWTANGVPGTRVDSTDHELSVTGDSTMVMRDSGWQPIPASTSADDFLFVDVGIKISNAARACYISGATVWMRWVST